MSQTAVRERGPAAAHAAEPAPVLRATGLRKRYGNHEAVRGVSFSVRPGEVYGFLGPNGSGKSTTIAMILGLVEPTEGRVELFGLGPERRQEALARVGAIIERPTFYPYLSGFDNLSVLAALRGGIPTRRLHEVLELVGLADAGKKPFGKYSLGMKQRLGIAWTLVHDPELIILDEPTNGLDPAGMMEVRHLILQLSDAGKTVFLSSHLLNEVEQVCDRVAILRRGEVVVEGSVAELTARGHQTLVRVDEPARAEAVLRAIPGVEQVEQRDGALVVRATEVPARELTAALVHAGVGVDEIRPIGNSLESTFLEITGEQGGEVRHG
ncbi:MAG: ABC transporter ATP-binding protein [Sphaerobacter sp.]|nr:ABC transporter ATP-binding protein [Sphaerobacter sp.]